MLAHELQTVLVCASSLARSHSLSHSLTKCVKDTLLKIMNVHTMRARLELSFVCSLEQIQLHIHINISAILWYIETRHRLGFGVSLRSPNSQTSKIASVRSHID